MDGCQEPEPEYKLDGIKHFININYPGLKVIHTNPWIFTVDDLLTEGECDSLVDQARQLKMKSSTRRVSNMTAEQCVTRRNSTDVRLEEFSEHNDRIYERYCKLLYAEMHQLETMKVTMYDVGQQFQNHVDPVKSATQDNRVVTLLLYLNDDYTGGRTRFVSLPDDSKQLAYEVGEEVLASYRYRAGGRRGGDYPAKILSVDHKAGTVEIMYDDGEGPSVVPKHTLRKGKSLTVEPKKGMGLVFLPAFLDGSDEAEMHRNSLDPTLVHEGLVVTSGTKWISQQWAWSNVPSLHPLAKQRSSQGLDG